MGSSKILLLTFLVAATAVSAQRMTPTLTPSFLRYDSKIEVVFTLEPACDTSYTFILYSISSQDGSIEFWDSSKTHFARHNSSAVRIKSADYSLNGTFYASCLTSPKYDYEALVLSVPVAPQILKVAVKDVGGKSTERSAVTSSDGYYIFYEWDAHFDHDSSLATLQIDTGDGAKDAKNGTLKLSGDTDLIVQQISTVIVDKEPNYPNGTNYYYRLNATKWSTATEPKCVANLTARTHIKDEADLWHEAIILMNLNYKAQILKAHATSKPASCEVACEVNSACPYVDVTLELELYDDSNKSIATPATLKTSRQNRVAITDLSYQTCQQLVDLAKNQKGYAKCKVTNAVGTREQIWKLSDVTDLSGLLISDGSIVLNWWEILLIVLASVFFAIILLGLTVAIVRRRRASDKEIEKDPQELTYVQQPPPAVDQSKLNPNIPPYVPPGQLQQQQQFFNNGGQQEFIRAQEQPVQQGGVYQRPVSQAGSSYYDGGNGGYIGDYDGQYVPSGPSGEPLASEYRTVTFQNAPRSRAPIVAGPPVPAPVPTVTTPEAIYYDNQGFARTPATQRSFRAEAIV